MGCLPTNNNKYLICIRVTSSLVPRPGLLHFQLCGSRPWHSKMQFISRDDARPACIPCQCHCEAPIKFQIRPCLFFFFFVYYCCIYLFSMQLGMTGWEWPTNEPISSCNSAHTTRWTDGRTDRRCWARWWVLKCSHDLRNLFLAPHSVLHCLTLCTIHCCTISNYNASTLGCGTLRSNNEK